MPEKYFVHLCAGCIADLEKYYPYTVPRERLRIIKVPVTDCANANHSEYTELVKQHSPSISNDMQQGAVAYVTDTPESNACDHTWELAGSTGTGDSYHCSKCGATKIIVPIPTGQATASLDGFLGKVEGDTDSSKRGF